MLNLNIYTKYKVVCKGNYSYINEYGDFSDGYVDWEEIMNCDEILKFLKRHFDNQWFDQLVVTDDKIQISEFDPTSGETSYFEYTFTEVDDEIA